MKLYDVIKKENKLHEDIKTKEEHSFVLTEQAPKKHRFKKIFFYSFIAFLIATIYALGISFVRSKITIFERNIPFTVEKISLEIPHEPDTSSKRLSFQTMTVSTEINRELFGSELVQTTGKAKGSIVFINEYSKSNLTIKSGTKIISQNGKSYTTQETATISGYTLSNKKKTAGTSNAISIVATDTGPSYNSKGTSFSISGYSGAKKTQLYARSVGEITGGESGMRHTISDKDRPAVLESLKTQLSERLKRETRAQIPEGFITFPDLQFISIDTDSLKLEGEGVKFSAKIKGTMVSYLLPQDLFESAIAKEVLSDPLYNRVSIPKLFDLKVEPESAIPTNPQTIPSSINIKISGEGNIITKANTEILKQTLLGKETNKFESIISQFPEIESAKFRVFPFWSPFFPKEDRLFNIETK